MTAFKKIYSSKKKKIVFIAFYNKIQYFIVKYYKILRSTNLNSSVNQAVPHHRTDENVTPTSPETRTCNLCVTSSAVKRLIASKIKLCLHNIRVCTVYIYYVYINKYKHMHVYI